MPMTEKELNCILMDKLNILEDIEFVLKKEDVKGALELIARKRRQIEQQLYQKPPLKGN